jgi:anti-anti-sigma regulatory factor
MLRITTSNNSEDYRLMVEGRLAGPCVSELEKCWRAAALNGSKAGILVDLSDVSFVDPTGKRLLAQMYEEGAKLVATGLMTRFLIEEIEAQVSGDR